VIAGYAALHREAAAMQRDIRALRQAREFAAAPRRTALGIAGQLGIALDPYQGDALSADEHDILLLVCRQGGKGEVATLLALDKLLNDPGSTTLVVSRADRQSKRLLRRIKRRYRQLAQLSTVPAAIAESQTALELMTGSEVLAVPGSEETIRGIEAVDLLVIDEAALVDDELFGSVYPMLATTDGRCIAMTTPRGKRGWFWREWEQGGPEWHRERITWEQIPRFKPSYIERTRRRIGEWMFRQEFGCEFVDDAEQMFATALVEAAFSPDVQPLALPIFAGRVAP
jgi:hypothetical protein